MHCSNCGQQTASIRRRSKAYGKDDSLIVVENVPMISCRECGMDFLSIKTVGQLERLRDNLAEVPVRPVHVAIFRDEADPVLDELAEAATLGSYQSTR